jgi:hypothetical protein
MLIKTLFLKNNKESKTMEMECLFNIVRIINEMIIDNQTMAAAMGVFFYLRLDV